MLFSFSKEFIPAQWLDGFGVLFGCRLFRVFAGGEPVGQYFGHKDVSFFAYGNTNLALLFGGICLLEKFTDLASFRVTIGD